MLTWLGHSSFKLECNDSSNNAKKIIYVDPWLSGPTCPENEKNPNHADLILVTHCREEAINDIIMLNQRTGAMVVGAGDFSRYLHSKGASSIYFMNKGGEFENSYIIAHMVHADNSSPELSDKAYIGTSVGFVINFKDGSPAVYFAGNTNVNSEMRIISDLYSPDIAILPIEGRYTMGPVGAAYAVTHFLESVKATIPMSWEIGSEAPQQLAKALQPQHKVYVMSHGETIELRSII
ncbi:unnamed protein product [Blepharisma stoltei]|uniref:Uncharacterized protein n=1 Tax=Blepharisma stoltei TaxID=1481888 RepID=A0AAU9IGK8_9CILI|nr:unnamed protein product [Blepharisma stoltei]